MTTRRKSRSRRRGRHHAAYFHRRAPARRGRHEHLRHALGFEISDDDQPRTIRRPGELEYVLVHIKRAARRHGAVRQIGIGREQLELIGDVRIGEERHPLARRRPLHVEGFFARGECPTDPNRLVSAGRIGDEHFVHVVDVPVHVERQLRRETCHTAIRR